MFSGGCMESLFIVHRVLCLKLLPLLKKQRFIHLSESCILKRFNFKSPLAFQCPYLIILPLR